MIKNQPRQQSNEPVCKKIQNYIFKFSDLLGQGNFSKVYKAHHEITSNVVAIKIVQLNSLKSQKLEELLFSEIDVLKKLNHPNILRCFQVFTSNRNCYIITEICNGGDLESKLRKQHHFSEQSVQPIIKDIFCGLLYLAQRNVIHRDLKVANVFLHNGRAKIADFGFAKFTKENFKDINIGSPIYMSPEGLIHNIYGPKTDIWAFGVLIYQLLHGETPYAHCRTEAELKYNVNVPINPKKFRSQLSSDIKQVIIMCMEIDESKRITAFQLQELPYFRKILQKSPLKRFESPMMGKKFSSESQRLVVPPNSSSQQAIQRHNFLLPKDQTTPFHLPSKREVQNRKSKSPFPGEPISKTDSSIGHHENRGLSSDNRAFGFGKQKNYDIGSKLTINGSSNSHKKIETEQNAGSSKIFSAAMTFKECVNILHYCRLIYKYVTALKSTHPQQQNQIRTLSTWVLLIMAEIKKKINENGIIYEGQNSLLREKKLREVTNEYTKKYNLELIDLSTSEMSMALILPQIQNFYMKIDAQIPIDSDSSWTFLGHYIVMIVECTNMLNKCYLQRSYKMFSNFKELETFLNKNRDSMDLQSYKILRKKISFIGEKGVSY